MQRNYLIIAIVALVALILLAYAFREADRATVTPTSPGTTTGQQQEQKTQPQQPEPTQPEPQQPTETKPGD